jgi:hypothetical protein
VSRQRKLRIAYDPEDRERSVYHYLAFEVPPGAAGVAVAYRYAAAGAVIDLGLFDPDGFRGWSGGARSGAVVTEHAATPGYLAGVLPAGEWQVILGLHRVPDDGVEVTVTIDTDAPPPPPPPPLPPRAQRPPPRDAPAREGYRWLAADLHTHTLHSDGGLTVDQLAALAVGRGLDVLAVTDHNTVSHHPLLPPAGTHAGIHLLPGQEVTTSAGHANCFGDVGWIDFRQSPERWVEMAQAQGGAMSINHPLSRDCGWSYPTVPPVPLIEAWHCSWDRRSPEPLRWLQRHRAAAVGGSDFHDHGAGGLPGQPTTWIELPDERSAIDDAAVLEAITTGATTISAEPTGPVLWRHEDGLIAGDAEGLVLVGPEGRQQRICRQRQRIDHVHGANLLVGDDGLVHALSI